jgi:hypothetical protein
MQKIIQCSSKTSLYKNQNAWNFLWFAVLIALPRASVRTAWSSLHSPTEKCVLNFIVNSEQQKCAKKLYKHQWNIGLYRLFKINFDSMKLEINK